MKNWKWGARLSMRESKLAAGSGTVVKIPPAGPDCISDSGFLLRYTREAPAAGLSMGSQLHSWMELLAPAFSLVQPSYCRPL